MIVRSIATGYFVKLASWVPLIGKLLLVVTLLSGLVFYVYQLEHENSLEIPESEYVERFTGHVSSTSDESIEELCRELAEAQNMCWPEKTYVLLAAKQKPQIDGVPHQKNASCDFEIRKRTEHAPQVTGSTGQPNRMAEMLCDFVDGEV